MTSLLTTFPNSADASASMLPCHDAEAADLFFSERPADLEQAKTLCAGCPLIDECRQGALDRAEPWGVWGGAIFDAGRIIAVKRRRVAARGSASRRGASGLAEDPVQLGAALRAHGLGHATTVGDDDVALGLPLLPALDAVELSGIGLVGHVRSSLFVGDVHS